MNYQIFKGIKVLKEPTYNGETPKILGIYHPLNSEIYILNDDEWKIFNDISSSKEVVKNEIFNAFYEKKIIHEKGKDLKIDLTYTPDDAQMYVKLTEACNFACPGCTTSIDRIKAGQAKLLEINTLNLYLESFIKSAHEKKMSSVKIKWAGGEPLLNNSYPLIKEAQPKLEQLAKQYPDVKVKQVILTNGVFINLEKVEFFKKNNITLSVSLWGTGKTQDDARKPRNKTETYEPIIKNITMLEENGVEYSINYVLTPTNAHNFAEFIETAWDINSPKFIGKDWKNKHPITLFIAFYRPQTNISKYTSRIMYKIMLNGLREGFEKIKELINNKVPIQTLNIIDYLNLTGISPYTCGTGINYVAVGPEGAASCHEDLFGMDSNLNSVKAGANIIDLVNQKHTEHLEFLNGISYTDHKYFDYMLLHGGLGCPRLRTAENSDDWKNNLGTTADFYKSFIDDLLALECIRMQNQ